MYRVLSGAALIAAAFATVAHRHAPKSDYKRKNAMSRILWAGLGLPALAAMLIFGVGLSASPASASDLCMASAAKDQRPKPYYYPDFYSGWKALTYSFERISEASATGQDKELATHLLRVCSVTEGLKRFVNQIGAEERQGFLASLNQSQGVVGALEDARVARNISKYPELLRQLDSITSVMSSATPACWRSIASTLHGRNQIACR